MHTYYNQCDKCGALLDPGEICNCSEAGQDQRHEDQSQDLFYDLLAEQQENQR